MIRLLIIKKHDKKFNKKFKLTLAGVAQLIEFWPANQRVSLGPCLGCWPGPQCGGA